MKSTYLIGYDHQMKIWEVNQVFTEYPKEYWVFKMVARDEQAALHQATQCFQELCRPSATRMALYHHLCKKTLGLMSYGMDMLVVDIPERLREATDRLIDQHLLVRGEGNQVVIGTQGPLWKYLEEHFKPEVYAPRREEILEI